MSKNLTNPGAETLAAERSHVLQPFQAGEERVVRSPLPPVPARDEVLEYLQSFDLFDQVGHSVEGMDYARHHVDRFLKTLEYIPRLERPVKVLELGASPYFMSILVRKYLGYDLTPANFFGDYDERFGGAHSMVVSSKRHGESYTFDSIHFNVERDRFPYPDGQFDLVLFCELLEHLPCNPSHTLRESHRVLKPGGSLVVSTPNAVRLENLLRMLGGTNVYARCSGYGVYGRHNREYTAHELHDLLAANHFDPRVVVDDVYPHGRFLDLANKVLRGRRDNLFGIGRKVGQTIENQPEWLYEHRLAKVRACTNYVIMGSEEYDQLSGNWSDFEYGPPGVRWMGRQANARLAPKGHETRVGFHAENLPRDVRGSVLVNDLPAGEFSLQAGQAHDVIVPIPRQLVELVRAHNLPYCDITIRVDSPDDRALPIEKLGLLG